jgi:hypothetical protein
MNSQERVKVGEFWIGLAQMYGKDIPQIALKIMLDAVSDISGNEIMIALEEWSKNSKQNRHPLPGELREILRKELSIDAKANESANKIRQAITKFGWPEPDKAKEFMGDLAWAIVIRFGGWQYICQNHGVDLNPLTFHAQARDSAKSILEQGNLGVLDKPIGIDSPRSQDLQKLSWPDKWKTE